MMTTIVDDIAGLDAKGKASMLVNVDIQNRKNKFVDLWRLLKVKNAMTVQRSRTKWLKER